MSLPLTSRRTGPQALPLHPHAGRLSRTQAVAAFAAFAFAYLLSNLLRGSTATLAPVFSHELGLQAGQLGLLAGAYFLGFALMQLPLGSALDRWGPRRVLAALLALAVAGCLAFAAARGLQQLLLARLLIGAGVGACLMAPLTSYRHHFSASAQLRANSWMLMTGSVGMLAATLPVQWLLPLLGWRGIFVGVAGGVAVAVLCVLRWAPRDAQPAGQGAPLASRPGASAGRDQPGGPAAAAADASAEAARAGYRAVFAHPGFRRLAPLGFVVYGGLIAMQSLWIGPWLTTAGGLGPTAAAEGLFFVNLAMMLAFLSLGAVMPRLAGSGLDGERLIALGWPAPALCLFAILWLGADAPPWLWALWCAAGCLVSLSQPAIGQMFPSALAGRALSAYNLLIFSGVFAVQWGIGLAIDALQAAGHGPLAAYRIAFGGFGLANLLAVGCLLAGRRSLAARPPTPAA